MLERLGLSLGGAIYLVAVVAVGTLLLLRVLLLLGRTDSRRRERLEEKRWLDAVKMESPVEDPVARALEQGLETIDRNTTIARQAVVPVIVLFTGALAAIPFLDRVPAAILSVVVGAVTVVAGLAARPVIENAFAGLVIAFSKLINIGDTVMLGDLYGTVEDITVTHTTIRVWDWRRYVIANNKMMQSAVINYSLHDRYQWAHVEFFIGYDADLSLVRELATEAPKTSQYFADYESPAFWVMEMAERGIRCWVAAWAESPSSAWMLKCDMRESLLHAFKEHGITAHTYRVDVSGAA